MLRSGRCENMLQKLNSMRIWVFFCLVALPIPATFILRIFRKQPHILYIVIRFDNGNTRQHRKQSDKAAAISAIFLMLNSNLQKHYIAGANITVDEQLYGFRGGTGFT